MAYIWSDYDPKIKYRIDFGRISPYLEVWEREGNTVYVNVFYRLCEFLFPQEVAGDRKRFAELMERYEEDPRWQEIANLLMHWIAQADRQKGLSLQELVMWRVQEDILAGRYGDWLKEQFFGITEGQKDILLWYLAEYSQKRQRVVVYGSVLHRIFHTVRLYYEKSTGIVHLYIGQEQNEENAKLLAIIDYLFRDREIKVQVMWRGEHFGVIGVDETMRIGITALI